MAWYCCTTAVLYCTGRGEYNMSTNDSPPAYLSTPPPPQLQPGQVVRVTNTSRSDLNGTLVVVLTPVNLSTIRQTVHLMQDSTKTFNLRPINLSSSRDILDTVADLARIRTLFTESSSASVSDKKHNKPYELKVWDTILTMMVCTQWDEQDPTEEWDKSTACCKAALGSVLSLPRVLPHHELLLACLYEAVGRPIDAWITLKNAPSTLNAAAGRHLLESLLLRERTRNQRAFDYQLYNSAGPAASGGIGKYTIEQISNPRLLMPTTETGISSVQFYVETMPPQILLVDHMLITLARSCQNKILVSWMQGLGERDDLLVDPVTCGLVYARRNKLACTLGERMERVGDHAGACPYYQQCVKFIDAVHEVSPRSDYNMLQSCNYGNLAIALKNSNQYVKAESAYVHGINLAPDPLIIHNYCTMQFTRIDQYNMAAVAGNDGKSKLIEVRKIFSKTRAMLKRMKKMISSKRANVVQRITPLALCNYHLDMSKLYFHMGLVAESIPELEAMRDVATEHHIEERRHAAQSLLQHHQRVLRSMGGVNPSHNNMLWDVAMKGCNYCGALEEKGEDGGGGVALKKCGRCKTALYCSAECQRSDHRSHKKLCVKFNKKLLRELEKTTTFNLVDGSVTREPNNAVCDGYDPRTPSK